MTQHESRATDPPFSEWCETGTALDGLDVVRLSAARTRGMDDAGSSIARQLKEYPIVPGGPGQQLLISQKWMQC